MEVQFTPDVQARLTQRATQEGMNPDGVVLDVVARYFKEGDRFQCFQCRTGILAQKR